MMTNVSGNALRTSQPKLNQHCYPGHQTLLVSAAGAGAGAGGAPPPAFHYLSCRKNFCLRVSVTSRQSIVAGEPEI